jgi:Major Facilitator Superfamily
VITPFKLTRPELILVTATLVNTIGNGSYLTAGILYFTKVLHLPAYEVGLGFSAAGITSLTAGIPGGHLADRYSPRAIYASTLAGCALGMVGFYFTRNFLAFLLVACFTSVGQTAGLAARGPIIRGLGGKRPQELRAYLRSVTNLGIALGAVGAGVAVEVNSPLAYKILIVGNGASFAMSAAIVWFLPNIKASAAASGGPRWVALRDYPYIALTLLDGVLAIQGLFQTVAIPLWLTSFTAAPRWILAASVVINTVIVVIFQVRASKQITSAGEGGRAMRRAGFTLLISCIAISVTGHLAAVGAAALILAAVIIQAVGELWYAAGGFELSFGLAPEYAQGQYLGVYGMGVGLANSFGPALLTAVCIGWGTPGWVTVGILFAAAGLLIPPAVRWAEATRTRSDPAAT